LAETVFSLQDRASGPHWAITAAWAIWQYRWVDLDMGLPTPSRCSDRARQHCRRWSESTGERERFGILATDVAGQSILDPLSTEIELLSPRHRQRGNPDTFSPLLARTGRTADCNAHVAVPARTRPRCAPTSAGVDRALSGHHPIYVVDRINASHGVQHPI
jgi:hypothetical protein